LNNLFQELRAESATLMDNILQSLNDRANAFAPPSHSEVGG
jgi:hypothetical protein